MKTLLTIFTITLLFTGLYACNKKSPPSPTFNVRGIKTSIAKIQVSPLAFDGAQVVLMGFVAEVNNAETQDDKNVLVLSDNYGNTINVESEEQLFFEQNDMVLVGGKYRKNENLIISEEIIEVTVDKDGIKPLNDLEK